MCHLSVPRIGSKIIEHETLVVPPSRRNAFSGNSPQICNGSEHQQLDGLRAEGRIHYDLSGAPGFSVCPHAPIGPSTMTAGASSPGALSMIAGIPAMSLL